MEGIKANIIISNNEIPIVDNLVENKNDIAGVIANIKILKETTDKALQLVLEKNPNLLTSKIVIKEKEDEEGIEEEIN